MLWQDVLVECSVPDDTLASAVADVFAIESRAVRVLDYEDALESVDDSVLVLVRRMPLRGAFRLQVSLFLRDAGLERHVGSRPATLAALQRLAARLDCALIASDDSLDPSAWLLVRSSGAAEPVALDINRLDHDGFVSLLTPDSDRRAPAEIPA